MAVQTTGPEAAAVAVANTLTTYLNAKLDAINAVWADGEQLPHPKHIYPYEALVIPEYPALQVMNARGRLTDDMAPVYQGMAHQLIVEAICVNTDKMRLQKMVLRYLLAIQQALTEHPTLDGTLVRCTGIALPGYDVSGLAKEKNGPQMMQAGRWTAIVQSEEVLP